MDRRSRAGEIVDLVDLNIKRPGYVVPHELELRMVAVVEEVVAGTGEEIIDAQHLVPALEKDPDEVRA
jgi:hypothetical protein